MRINKWLAQASGLSRRAADQAISSGRVKVNGTVSTLGQEVNDLDQILLDDNPIRLPDERTLIILNKPVGYVCSRNGQGSRTIYNLLPDYYHNLKSIGRLDKNSSGLLLMTDDGDLANMLAHPRFIKEKKYEVSLDRPLDEKSKVKLSHGIKIGDYTSQLALSQVHDNHMIITMSQGRNRQIRRTFEALHYQITRLHRIAFGEFSLDGLPLGTCIVLNLPGTKPSK